jgi:Flp pilus assembly protein TadG
VTDLENPYSKEPLMRLLHSLLARYRRRSRSRGQSIVELALILPVLMLLVASTLDLGRMFYSQVTITNAAREGAYEAAYNPASFIANATCHTTNNRVMCRVLSEAKGSFVVVDKADVALACSPACATGIGNTVKVTVLGHFKLLTPILAPFLGGSDVTLTSSASAQIITEPPMAVAVPTATPTPTPSPSPSPTPSPTPAPTAGPTATPTASPSPTPSPVPCFAPTAGFTVSPSGGFKNTTLFRFTDTSTNMPVGSCGTVWSWNFGDGNGQGNGAGTSTSRNPTYTYSKSNTNPGFTVTLQVSNTQGSSTFTRVIRVDP